MCAKMKKYFYFIVEGVHDSAALGRYLKRKNISLIRKIEQVDLFWERIIPKSFPFNGDLLKRMPVPMFYSNEQYSIAIQTAGGDSGIVKAFDSLLNLDYEHLTGVALFCDADTKPAEQCFNDLISRMLNEVDEEYHSIFKEAVFGEVTLGSPSFGVYIFPNNECEGTLENLLLEGGEIVYSDLMASAKEYVKRISLDYRQKHWSISSEPKVLFGVMANALKPGKANQVSIQDNQWISEETITTNSQSRLNDFLEQLLN